MGKALLASAKLVAQKKRTQLTFPIKPSKKTSLPLFPLTKLKAFLVKLGTINKSKKAEIKETLQRVKLTAKNLKRYFQPISSTAVTKAAVRVKKIPVVFCSFLSEIRANNFLNQLTFLLLKTATVIPEKIKAEPAIFEKFQPSFKKRKAKIKTKKILI